MDIGTDDAFFIAVVNDLRARCSHGELSSHEGNQRLGRRWGSRAPECWRLGLERYNWEQQSRRLPDSTSQGKKSNTAIQYVSVPSRINGEKN